MTKGQKKYYLLIDTSTEVCTVALGSEDGDIIAERSNERQNKHAEVLAPMASELLDMIPQDGCLSGVGVAEGPGSYTGLRIGAAYAKGLCWTRQIPLVTMSTPELLTLTFMSQHGDENALYMPMIDARRMEVYSSIYTSDLTPLHDIHALILTDVEAMQNLSSIVGDRPLYYFGSGAEKAREVMPKYFKAAHYGGTTTPHSKAMLSPIVTKISASKGVDIAYWEPFYLKEYEAKKSTNKVLSKIIDK